jgi:putative flavoprotein involved in K+ transport
METTRAVVIGAGQAGLSMSRRLRDRGIEHVVLDRGGVGERWRSQRWDSFTLLSPNWQVRLPGHDYRGPDPEGFMTGAQIVAFLEAYARGAPVRTKVEVRAVTPAGHGWRVDTDQGVFGARHVVVATGDLDRPFVPELAAALPPDLVQLHACAYRNPQLLPDGAVLVVGSGPSGQQIADELARAGRSVHLAVGGHKALPRRYRGRDAFWWMERMGMLTRTVESLPRRRPGLRTPNSVLAGGVEDLDLHRLARAGVALHGRLTAVAGAVVRFADDLAENTRAADLNAERFRALIDEYVARVGLAVPEEDPPVRQPWTQSGGGELDLRAADIGAVIWATGFRRDFSWVQAQVFDAAGEPVQRRGVTAADGLYFLGLRWMHTRASSFLSGVGSDAEYLADQIALREQTAQSAA